MKNFTLSVLFVLVTFSISAQELPTALQTAYDSYIKEFPITKVYLHTDRTLYKTNETLWFTAYIVDAQNKPTASNQTLFAELIDPKGNVVKRWNIRKQINQAFKGDFVVGQGNVGGIYKIRAYTNWMRNWGEDFYFEKEITVQNVVAPRLLMKLDFEKEAYSAAEEVIAKLDVREPNDEPLSEYSFDYTVSIGGKKYLTQTAKTNNEGKVDIHFTLPKKLKTIDGLLNVMIDFEGSTESISRSIPIVLNNVWVDFFPEGGYIMNGTKNKIAFKATNEFGEPADIKGILKNEKGQTISTFESYHQGLGAFELTANNNENYTVELTQPSNQTFQLPKALNKGIGIRKVNENTNLVSFYIHTNTPQTIHLVAEAAGKIHYSETFTNAKSGIYNIKTDSFPLGIMKFTVFDAQLHPQAERLTFLHSNRKIHIKANFNKKKYSPGERINFYFTAQDETGKGVEGNFSLAVVDDQWHTFADDKQDNILSYLLMSSELQGDVFEPSFYFNKKEKKATKALDYVMMTHGWRRFGWREIMEQQPKTWANKIQYKKNQVYLKGTVFMNGKPQKGAKVFFANNKKNSVKTDKNGLFQLPVNMDNNNYQVRQVNATYRGFESKMNVNWSSYNYELPSFSHVTTPVASVQDLKNQLEVKVEEVKETPVIAVINNRNDVRKALTQQASGVQVTTSMINQRSVNRLSAVMVSSANVEELVTVGYGTYSSTNNDGFIGGYGMDVNINPASIPRLSMRPTLTNSNQFYYGRNFVQARYYPNRNQNAQVKNPATLLWNPWIRTNNKGHGSSYFYATEKNTTYRAIIEGISDEGKIGRAETTFVVESPFSVEVKMPEFVTTGDQFLVSVLLKNNTDKKISAYLSQPNQVTRGNNYLTYLKLPPATNKPIVIKPNEYSRQEFLLDAGNTEMLRYFLINIRTNAFSKAFQSTVKVASKGFDRSFSFSDNAVSKKVSFDLDEYEPNSLIANFTAYPNITSELEDGVKGMLREPHGCFEQVSSSNYPNVYAMIYMKEMEVDDKEAKKTARKYMSKAYTKLAGYECVDGGFDWYGQSPADERLTAYGLLEFMDMKKFYNRVDQNMIDRTAAWLTTRLKADGSWEGGYYGYNRYAAVHNAYITHAMSVYGKINIENSIKNITNEAENSLDWYRLSLATMSNWNVGNHKKAAALLDILIDEVNKKGLKNPFTGKTITYSYGHSANVETLSLIAQAIIQQNRSEDEILLMQLIQNIATSKTRRGYFGSTQATVQALKALVEYSKISKQVIAKGEIQLLINNTKVLHQHFSKKDKKAVSFDLKRYLKKGKNTFEVKLVNNNKSIPYTLAIGWKTLQPSSSPDCRFDFNAAIAKNEVKSGETVRLTATLKNPSSEDLFSPIALVGIPSGLSLQPWQLKELQERKAFDYYEIQDNYLVLYFRHLKGQEVKNVHLDLKADIVGRYKGGASSAYLYYGAEDKKWQSGLDVVVK
ncbi:MAG: MG2 domain-containing protein [Saprospiraceae bacterium]